MSEAKKIDKLCDQIYDASPDEMIAVVEVIAARLDVTLEQDEEFGRRHNMPMKVESNMSKRARIALAAKLIKKTLEEYDI